MSTALVQSIEQLLLVATTRLTAEIQAEKDPKRLETLLTLAFRAKIPRALTPTPEPTNRRRAPQRESAIDTPTSTSSTPSLQGQSEAPEPVIDSLPNDDPEDELLRDYKPMTQEEVEKLEREIGFVEANRRRLQYFDLAYKTAMRKARLRAANSS